jgi:hypothetical protein
VKFYENMTEEQNNLINQMVSHYLRTDFRKARERAATASAIADLCEETDNVRSASLWRGIAEQDKADDQ